MRVHHPVVLTHRVQKKEVDVQGMVTVRLLLVHRRVLPYVRASAHQPDRGISRQRGV